MQRLNILPFICINVIPMEKNKTEIKGFTRIIAPVDGSKAASKAVQKALYLAKETKLPIVALYVVDTPRLTETIPPDEIAIAWEELVSKEGRTVLDEVEKEGSKIGVSVEKKLVEGIPEEVIMKEAKKNDLIILGCKGKSEVDRILMGSVCEKVARHATSQVMIIR
jgi:nucleotide-binding universal stress UspA family protein